MALFSAFQKQSEGDASISIGDVIKELPSGFASLGQQSFRAFGGIAAALTRKPFTPTGQFQQDLFGTNKPITLQSVGQEFRGGRNPSRFDAPLGLFAGIADAVPTGKQVKGILGATEEVVPAVSKLIGALKTAGKARTELDTAIKAERAARAGKLAEVFDQGKGQQGFFSGLSQLKGELAPQAKNFTPIKLEQPDVDSLFNQIQQFGRHDVYEKITASTGLQRLLEGNIPAPSQLSLLEDVFGKELIETIRTKRSGMEKLKDALTEAVNIPRSFMTSFDMSAPLRQGVVLTVTKPKAAAASFGEMFKQAFSQKNFETWLETLPDHPLYRVMKDSDLYISNPTKVSGGLSVKEEKFMTNLAEKVPLAGSIVKASERAYVSYLNKLRVDTFSQLTAKFSKEGITPESNPEAYKALASWVNNATGRGELGSFSRVSQQLNTLFFSPRLIASRFNLLNPVWYAKQPAPVRKEAIKSMAEFIGIGATVLGLAKLNDDVTVETDPRSSDFGKMRIGDVRMDIWGGFQQWVRVFSQLASGQRKTTGGKIVNLQKDKYPFETRKDVAERFAVGKLAPVPGLLYEMLQGQKAFGEPITLKREIMENTIPLYLQDFQDYIDEVGPDAVFEVFAPSFFGVGAQIYKDSPKSGGLFSTLK